MTHLRAGTLSCDINDISFCTGLLASFLVSGFLFLNERLEIRLQGKAMVL